MMSLRGCNLTGSVAFLWPVKRQPFRCDRRADGAARVTGRAGDDVQEFVSLSAEELEDVSERSTTRARL
jgi:hypothetical protein